MEQEVDENPMDPKKRIRLLLLLQLWIVLLRFTVNSLSEMSGHPKFKRIRTKGENLVLSTAGVPTFKFDQPLISGDQDEPHLRFRGLEGILEKGPAFCLDGVLEPEACRDIIDGCEQLGFKTFSSGKNNHGAMQWIVSENLADTISQRIVRFVDTSAVEERMQEMNPQAVFKNKRLIYSGINRRWRIYKYAPGGVERFSPHIDAGFPPSGLSSNDELIFDDSHGENIVSRLTLLIYLNEDFVGGTTSFYDQSGTLLCGVRPKRGSCLVFPQAVGEDAVEYARKHWPLHEGTPVQSGSPKYVIRSDILFTEYEEEAVDPDDPHFRYDNQVKECLQPLQRTKSVYDEEFLRLANHLYNPHMGVEHIGPMLYSFLRVTKKRNILEIGSGFTSIWILQALRDNDDELKRVQQLEQEGANRLLDIRWTLPQVSDLLTSTPARLTCIDNCLHQKETASQAFTLAKQLGLDSYMQLIKGDAYELDLGSETFDVVWCDFGVGSRMKSFCQSIWPRLNDGGYLLCHSTLTNRNTREWLEAVRQGKDAEFTGIPADQCRECLSLLEPLKTFQNSITILQKRVTYEEPIYSQYA